MLTLPSLNKRICALHQNVCLFRKVKGRHNTEIAMNRLLGISDSGGRHRNRPPKLGHAQALHAARPDMAGLPVTAHAALLARVRLALMARGQAVVIEYV